MGRMLVAVLLAAMLQTASAQTPPPGEQGSDYSRFVKPTTEIATLGNDLFGDQTNLFTGETTFVQVDIDIPGNNALPVRLARRSVRDRPEGMLGGWDFDLPYLYGVFAASAGWQASISTDYKVGTNNRCSVDTSRPELAQPPSGQGTNGVVFPSNQYWYGNSMYMPGEGGQKMMVLSPSANRPTAGGPYRWGTPNGWVFSCLPSTANGVAGEGFLAHAKDGTRYYFNWFATAYEKGISATLNPFPGQGYGELSRAGVIILPTRVEDRFGNYVTYTYDPQNPRLLKSIQSSDGRSIQIAYSGTRLLSATAAGRTWTYQFSTDGLLSAVIQPDGSSWRFEPARLGEAFGTWRNCADYTPAVTPNSTMTMVHPSGAVGSFELGYHKHGRDNVPLKCFTLYSTSYPHESKWIDTVSLYKKTISGPGISSPLTWSFDYGTASGNWESECASKPCPGLRVLTVTAGDGTWKRYTFSSRYNDREGKRLSLEVGSSAGLLYKEDTGYLTDPAGAFGRTGVIPCLRCDKADELPIPVSTVTIRQDGVDFTKRYSNFDSFARPRELVGSNTASANIRQEGTTYYDDLSKWVVGQVQKTTVNGVLESELTYDTLARPQTVSSFGKRIKTFTYNADGTVSSVMDGNNHRVTLSNWKRGVARSIKFDDGTATTGEVNDFGQATSFTDENGYTTSYGYDSMGRLTSIAYPAGDSTVWNGLSAQYSQVANAEYGIAASHWKGVVSTGNARKETYYDAFWRPLLTREYDGANMADTQSVVVRGYDYEGRTSFESYPLRSVQTLSDAQAGVSTAYDALGRVTKVTQASELGPLESTVKYLSGGQALAIDPRMQQKVTRYQMFGEPSYERPASIEAGGVRTDIVRDVFGKPQRIERFGTPN